MTHSLRIPARLTVLAAALLLAACSGGGSSSPDQTATPTQPVVAAPTTAVYEVTLVNLTAGQPLSPMVVVAHNDGFAIFNVGEAASVALEHLAEAGESAPLAALANDSKSVYAAAVAPGDPLVPGAGNKAVVTLTVPVTSLPTLRLSMASMLSNTNDGFAGLSGESLAKLEVGATLTTRLLGYDAGTEANTESADTLPGPAAAGVSGKHEGFNATRDDVVNFVHLHPGVVSKDDGLPKSALTQAQRWDNPVALLSIKRTQ